MDAFDIFRKLTTGVRFTHKNKSKPLNAVGKNTKTEVLKTEIKSMVKVEENRDDVKIEEDVDIDTHIFDHSDDDGDYHNDDSVDIKSEVEEKEDTFQLISSNGATEISACTKKQKRRKFVDPAMVKQLQAIEEVNNLRKEYRINVRGKMIPPPIKTFEELEKLYNVSSRLLDNIGLCGFPLPTPIQMQAIPVMLQGRPLMACAPTGSGKTVAFLAPVIRDLKGPQRKGFRAVILCPTRELAKQIFRECVRLTDNTGLQIHIINKIKQVESKYGPESNKKYDILISTPNRIRYLLKQDPPILDFSNIEWVIIDEADKLMEDGQNSFKEQLDDILSYCTSSMRKIALFSATYTVPVAKWALKNLKGLIRVTVGEQNSATDLVDQQLLFVGSESGKLLAFRDLVRSGLQPPVLIFVQSKDRAKQLFNELIYDGINVDVIHADRTQQQRDNVVRAFREGKIWVLICTELMGRGIDFKGVNLVINYDFPPTPISYIHRIGRTGRAGRRGKAITYYTQDDTTNLRSIAQIIKNSGGKVPDFMLTLKKTKKSDRKKLATKALNREDISTGLKRKRNEIGKFVKAPSRKANYNKKPEISKRKRRKSENVADTKKIKSD